MKEYLNILGYKVSTKNVSMIVECAINSKDLIVVNTLNPHSYVESKQDKKFQKALTESDVIIPDGSGIVWAARQLYRESINKVAGSDLFFETMNFLEQKQGSVFFLGSTNEVLEKIVVAARVDFPRVQVHTFSPPYKKQFSKEDIEHFLIKVNEISPDVLFVGLTAPKQEKLILDMRNSLSVKMVSGIGAVFDFYAGTVKRPNDIWIKLHLEWLIRLIGEPKRLWRRTFISAPIFLLDVAKRKYNLIFYPKL